MNEPSFRPTIRSEVLRLLLPLAALVAMTSFAAREIDPSAGAESAYLALLATSVLLSVFFVLVYGSTNWLTASRPAAHVGVWYFAWELAVIPYVPVMIVPYMSIDLLFFAAPFLCRDEREMRTFARRVLFSILVATAFFLLLPLIAIFEMQTLLPHKTTKPEGAAH